MERAADLDDFLRGPPGRYVAERTWIEFCADDGVAGHLLWGRPDGDDAQNFMRLQAPEGSALAKKRGRLFDVRRLESPDATAFAVFAERLVRHAPLLSELVSRVAVVHGGGLSGALVEGFQRVAFTPFPVEFFTDAVQALEWLGAADPRALAAELEALHARATGTTPLLRNLRALLAAPVAPAERRSSRPRPHRVSLADAARGLGVSRRTLQRELRDQGTSFQAERSRADVAAAKRLLETDATIEEVAYRLGYASAQHFGALFRELCGQTPGEWRASVKR